MTLLYRLSCCLTVSLLCLLLLAPAKARCDAAAAASLKPDVRLLIDISGSMRQSDPDNLRAPALDLIVRLLPEGAKAGVWIFGETVTALVPHRIIDQSWRDQAATAVAAINNSGLRTHIPAALQAAIYDIGSIDPGYRPSIVLLTDGKVDVSESPMANAAAARKLLEQSAPSLKATGIPVHTIALSDDADWEFLRSLAAITGGVAEKAETAGKLTEVYYQALETVAPMERVPLEGDAFIIDDNVREFTALAFFEPGQADARLESPLGQLSSPQDPGSTEAFGDVLWFQNDQFAAVTIHHPVAGQWRLITPGSTTARVTVVSDMSLAVDPLPNSLPAGRASELGIALQEKGRTITDPEFLALLDIVVEINGPKAGELFQLLEVSALYPPPASGEYRVSVPAFEDAGRYSVTVQVSGKTFQRELPLVLDVLPPPKATRIITRSEHIVAEDLTGPLSIAGGVATAVLIMMSWYLWRRRRRRIESWRRRSRPPEEDLISGISADAEHDRP